MPYLLASAPELLLGTLSFRTPPSHGEPPFNTSLLFHRTKHLSNVRCLASCHERNALGTVEPPLDTNHSDIRFYMYSMYRVLRFAWVLASACAHAPRRLLRCLTVFPRTNDRGSRTAAYHTCVESRALQEQDRYVPPKQDDVAIPVFLPPCIARAQTM